MDRAGLADESRAKLLNSVGLNEDPPEPRRLLGIVGSMFPVEIERDCLRDLAWHGAYPDSDAESSEAAEHVLVEIGDRAGRELQRLDCSFTGLKPELVIEKVENDLKPVATYDRYLAVREHADAVDRQRLFGAFLDLVEGLGWRVGAICELRATDADLTVNDARPYGRLRKRAETEKMGVAQWVPMSPGVRAAVLAALERNAAIGEAPLFPAPRRAGAWTRHHAKGLLERAEVAARKAALKREDAETAAMLAPLDGSDFHAYRRAWATARKHLPLKDVAEAGGWRSTETLLRCYTQVDEATMLAVVSETRKVRAAGSGLG
jgi:integrase